MEQPDTPVHHPFQQAVEPSAVAPEAPEIQPEAQPSPPAAIQIEALPKLPVTAAPPVDEQAARQAADTTDELTPVPALLVQDQEPVTSVSQPTIDEQTPEPTEEPAGYEVLPSDAQVATGLTPEQSTALQEAGGKVAPGRGIEVACSQANRRYALVDICGALVETDTLVAALDELFAAQATATAALHAGTPLCMSLVAQVGALVIALSPGGDAQIVIQTPKGTRLGKLSLLARRAQDAITELELNTDFQPTDIAATVLHLDLVRTTEVQTNTGNQQIKAFSGAGQTVVIAGTIGDTDALAGAVEKLYATAAKLADMLKLGQIDRLLLEAPAGGMVATRCAKREDFLLAVLAESTGKMGAANLQMGKICAVLRGDV